MLDVTLFEALHRGEISAPDFAIALEGLARLPLLERAVYLGLLEVALVDAREAVRVAAVRVLAGANGRPAFRALLRALSDQSAAVRQAAVESFATSAAKQPSRWIHLLFHPEPDVRLAALERLPESQRGRVLFLLPDPIAAPLILSWLASERRPRLPAAGFTLVLGLWRAGHLAAPVAAKLLDDLEPSAVLDYGNFGPRRAPELCRSLVLAGAGAREHFGGDALDPIFAIVLGADDLLRKRLLLRFTEQILQSGPRLRAAAAMLANLPAQGPEGSSEERATDAFGLVCHLAPEAFGARAIPVAARRRAARALFSLNGTPPAQEKEALESWIRELCEDASGHVDLSVVAGLLRLARFSESAEVLAAAVDGNRLIEAFLRDPIASAPLLSPRLIQTERRALLGRLRAADSARFGAIVALSLWVLPIDQLAPLSDLEPEQALAVLPSLFELEQRPEVELGIKKVRALVQRFVELLKQPSETVTPELVEAKLPGLLRSWLRQPAPAASNVAVRLVGTLLGPLNAETFVRLLLELEPEALARLLEVLPHCPGISFGQELALAHALQGHALAPLCAWADERLGAPGRVPFEAPAPAGKVRLLTPEEQQRVLAADERDLERFCRGLRGERTLGLPEALRPRAAPAGPQPAVVAALFGACDEVAEVAAQVERFSADLLGFLEELEALAVGQWAHTPELPLLGAAWLWRWERQALRVGELAVASEGGIPRLLEWGKGLAFAALRESVWSACARCLAIWGARNKNQFWQAVADGKVLVRAALDELDTELGDAAAELLLVLYRNQVPALSGALAELRELLPNVALSVANKLDLLLDTRGFKFRATGVRQHQRSVPEAELRVVRASSDLAELSQACTRESHVLVQEAVLRLLELPRGEATLAALLGRAHELRLPGRIAESIPLWSDADALGSVRELLLGTTTSSELRFRVALAFLERGERALLPLAYAAALDPDDDHWFSAKDYQRLCDADSTEGAWLMLARSPHPHAYRPAVLGLLGKSAVLDAERMLSLRGFLEGGTDRDATLRLSVAERLALLSDDLGFPLRLSQALTRRNFESSGPLLRDPTLFLAATRGVLLAGEALDREHAMVDLLAHAPVVERDLAFQEVLLDSHNAFAAERAVRSLDERQARIGKLQELAGLFAWGFRIGLVLTGRHHRPHMTSDGAYGYVRRNDPRVYVTPLPLLRGDPNGKDVVEGLILHELGHHRWHSGPANDSVWAAAEKVKMHRLLNLVADEHLERNLRALQPEWGDKLKRLAAYAFQHAAKEIEVSDLLRVLGVNAFAVLSSCSLELGHDPNRVRVDSGALLRTLSELGHSFARFMRALRMGLGNRHEDPKVEAALALFRPSFKKLEMPALLDVAYKLRDIFGDDAVLLDGFGGAETVDEGERQNTIAKGTLDDRDIQPEVERILDPRKLKGNKSAGRGGGTPPKLSINVTGVPHFDKIEKVERLIVDPGAHQEVVREVARPARRLRSFFEELGIQRSPVRFRTSGTRLDRPRLGRLVLLSDPRVLTARQPRFDTDLFLGVVVDCSGSMEAADNIIKARRFAVLVAEAAKGLAGIDVRVFGFTDAVIYDAGDARRCAASSLEAGGGNNDAGALLHVAEIAKRSRRRAKLLVMVSDGLPTDCSAQALTDLVKHLEKREHMVLAQVAVRPLEEQCFTHYVRLDQGDASEVVRRFGETIARLVSKALR